jgi:Tfp pilus assembly protein PilO
MSLVSLKPSSKGITILIALAIVIFVCCTLGYLGAASKLNVTASDIGAKEKQLQDSTKIAQTLEESKLKFLDTRAQIRFLESSVSTHAYVPTLLKQIELLGKSVNLKVLSIRPKAAPVEAPVRKLSSGAQAAEGNVDAASQPKPGEETTAQKPKAKVKPYDELIVDIELEGEYMDALDFLYRLTSFPKIIAVNSMVMAPVDSTPGVKSPALNIKINVTAFVLKDSKPAPKPEAAGASVTSNTTVREGGTGNEAG